MMTPSAATRPGKRLFAFHHAATGTLAQFFNLRCCNCHELNPLETVLKLF
jgi:hypothetical protein